MSTKAATRQQGIALISALIFLVITVVFVSTALLVSSANKRQTRNTLVTTQAQFAAEAGIERLIHDIWYGKKANSVILPGQSRDLEKFREGLDALGLKTGELSNGAFEFSSDPLILTDDFGDSRYRLTAKRVDLGPNRTLIRLNVVGEVGLADNPLARRRITEDIALQPPNIPAYALLTNNANCIFCHTTISSLDSAYDENGKFWNINTLSQQERIDHVQGEDRIKVGVLESLMVDRADPSKINSLVAGTIYTRGITNMIDSKSTLRTIPFIDSSSRLSDKGKTLFTETNCSGGCKEEYQQFYTNYPLKDGNPPDGILQDTFPLPVKDENSNKYIDHSEWSDAVKQSSSGNLTGGLKTFLATTQATNSAGIDILVADKVSGFQNRDGTNQLSTTSSSRGVAGNLVLEGTNQQPLILEGNVYVDGDVVISGFITGSGKIIARGNVYVVGDIKYACDDNALDATWINSENKSCNYGKKQSLPQFGLVAGGNMIIGAYTQQQLWKDIKANSTYTVPTDHLTRTDFSSTSQEDIYRWFIDPGFVPTDSTTGNPLETADRDTAEQISGYTMSFTMIEVALFNQLEYEKVQANASYIPRFYTMREGSPVFRCKKVGEGGCKKYDDADLIDVTAAEPSLVTNATVLSLSPTDSWLSSLSSTNPAQDSELAVRKFWVDNIEANASQRISKPELQIDGILYSSNAVFALAPAKSAIQGQVTLHGSLMAADTGILVPGANRDANRPGLNIYYDSRLRSLLDIEDQFKVVQIRANYRVLEASFNTDSLFEAIPESSGLIND